MNINNKYLDTNNYLRHITDVSPKIMGDYLLPRYNHDAYGEKYDYYVFAASYGPLSKALYFLKNQGFYVLTENESSSLAIIKSYDKYLDSFKKEIYMYFLAIEYFYKSISKEGIFVGEYVSKEKVPVIPNGILKMNINMALDDDELGLKPHIFICENKEYYKRLRKKLDLINNYREKITYLEELDYQYDNELKRIKVLK